MPLKFGDTEEGAPDILFRDEFREDRGAAITNSEGRRGTKSGAVPAIIGLRGRSKALACVFATAPNASIEMRVKRAPGFERVARRLP